MNNTENEMRGLDKIDNMDIAELRQILETVGVHPAALDAHPAFTILDRIEQQVKIANVILYLSERAITSQEEWYKEAYLAYRTFLLYDVIDEKDGVNKRTIYLAHLRRFCDSHPKYAPFLDEYIQEAEHQDGQEYWNNFDTISNAREDFILYATLSMEAPYEESI